ncbi:hypothetical protein ABZ312_11495 [Streptomyces sp. NPDC006207]
MTTLKIQAMTLNGQPYRCPECDMASYTLDTAGPIPGWPATFNCLVGCTWEDPIITNRVVDQILKSSSGRKTANDDDTFRIVISSVVLEGILVPEVTLADVKQIGGIYWRRIAKPALRKQKTRAKRAVRRGARNAVVKPVKKAAGAASAVALTTAWEAQAGGWDEQPIEDPCLACEGAKGFEIESRLYGDGWIDCSVCSGTGEAA